MSTEARPQRWPARLLGAATLWVCLFGASPPVAADGEPAALRAAKAKLRTELHELARFCTNRKLFGARYDVYETVIELFPDDEIARKRNGYARAADGGWRASRKKRPRNMAAGALPALRTRQADIARRHLEAVEQALRGQLSGRAEAWRGRAFHRAARIAPEDDEIRTLNGEVRVDGEGRAGAWILVETARSRERRAALRKAAQAALEGVPAPKATQPLASERHASVQWARGFQGDRARILGVSAADEVRRGLIHAEASFRFFDAALGTAPVDVPGLAFYVFATKAQGNEYLTYQPDVSASYAKYAAPLATVWIPSSNRVVIKSPERPLRLEGPGRQVIAALLGRVFGITGRHGWASEGLGLHLTWLLTGTRLLYTVRQTAYGEQAGVLDLSKRLRADGADWMAEARAVLARGDAPDLRLLLGKPVDTLTPEELLFGYVLSVYLLEGHAQALPDLLRAWAGVKDAAYDGLLGRHLGMDVITLAHRLRRWLDETRDLK